MDNSVAALRRFAQTLIEKWQSGFQDYRVVLGHLIYCGSLDTGLFFNAKPSLYSSIPGSLKREYFFELDFRIILPHDTNPLSEKVNDSVAHVTGARLFRRGNITRWGERVQQASFLRQANWDDRLAIELDISVNAEPYFEISPWWRVVYSDEEISEQRRMRGELIKALVPRERYETLKTLQARELRWRLCMALAHSDPAVLPLSLQRLRRSAADNAVLAASVKLAHERQLERPEKASITEIARQFDLDPPSGARAPGWVLSLESSCGR